MGILQGLSDYDGYGCFARVRAHARVARLGVVASPR